MTPIGFSIPTIAAILNLLVVSLGMNVEYFHDQFTDCSLCSRGVDVVESDARDSYTKPVLDHVPNRPFLLSSNLRHCPLHHLDSEAWSTQLEENNHNSGSRSGATLRRHL